MVTSTHNLSILTWFDSDDYCYRIVYKYPDYRIAGFARINSKFYAAKLPEIITEIEKEIEKAINYERKFDTEDFYCVTIPENQDWVIRVYKLYKNV